MSTPERDPASRGDPPLGAGPSRPMARLFDELAGGADPDDATTITALGAAFESTLEEPPHESPARDS